MFNRFFLLLLFLFSGISNSLDALIRRTTDSTGQIQEVLVRPGFNPGRSRRFALNDIQVRAILDEFMTPEEREPVSEYSD